MKTVILAGGLGTRLSEETIIKPKPMIEIGNMPIIWHIMKIFSSFGFNEFIICCGYKGYVIKEFFANYVLHTSDITFDILNNNIEIHSQKTEPWKITLVDTGETTCTGGRLLKVKEYIENEEHFFFTYGDGLSDININKLLAHHIKEGKKATLTAVKPPSRFGVLKLEGNNVVNFQEKPEGDNAWINGGFFVLRPLVLDLINGPNCIWEREPLTNLATQGELTAYKHNGFWLPMDTFRDKKILEELWDNKSAPWKVWK